MSVSTARLKTLMAFISGSTACTNSPEFRSITNELNELYSVRHVRERRRRWLLEVLHTTRTLDTTLMVFTKHYNCQVGVPSLGGYLNALTNHSHPHFRRLATHHHARYKNGLVKKRNHYMHVAAAYPTGNNEVDWIIGEMHNCLVNVCALE